MKERQVSKSSAKSATLSASTSMETFIFSPLCAPLGVDTGVSSPPVGVTELAIGLAASFDASTKRIWLYLPARQGRLAELGQGAVGQRQEVDALGRLEDDF